MKIYFVSGFLGSGKTTSIVNAGKILMQQGVKVGVITNDQGKYLVDNSFVKSAGLPSVEVANGCFCCNYDDFDAHILELNEKEKPDVIFAESVGSCADIVATVMKPILEFRKNHSISSSLSTFCDSRLLNARLSGARLPFSDDVIYIFDKQIEEADILVINKSDLLNYDDGLEIKKKAEKKYPEKLILLQSAFDNKNLLNWLALTEKSTESSHSDASMNIDYERYAEGELKMAWHDMVFTLSSSEDLASPVQEFMKIVTDILKEKKLGTGHIKLFIEASESESFKISLTGMDNLEILSDLPVSIGRHARIILNARVETLPDTLKYIINDSVEKIRSKYRLTINTEEENSFSPGIPKPVHRFK